VVITAVAVRKPGRQKIVHMAPSPETCCVLC
jgi:hypothetical protein